MEDKKIDEERLDKFTFVKEDFVEVKDSELTDEQRKRVEEIRSKKREVK